MNAAPRSAKRFIPTYILIALNIAMYAYTSWLGGNFVETDINVLAEYGQYNLAVFSGAYWQLFTAMFVHVNIAHIAGNMLFLLIFGLRAEDMFSIEEYLLIYFASGLAGNLLTLVYGPYMISAGASGAIFGIFGATTIYIRRVIGQSLIWALVFAFFWILITSGLGVNIFAHLGGLIVGLAIGYAAATARRAKAQYQYSYSYPR